MSPKQFLITIVHPPQESNITLSKESLAKRLKDSSSTFLTGVFFKGAENSGGNSLGGANKSILNAIFLIYKVILFQALFPIIHLNSDEAVIKEKKSNPRKLMRSVEAGRGVSLTLSQAVFEEHDNVDVAHNADHYNTNAIILVGCKVG